MKKFLVMRSSLLPKRSSLKTVPQKGTDQGVLAFADAPFSYALIERFPLQPQNPKIHPLGAVSLFKNPFVCFL